MSWVDAAPPGQPRSRRLRALALPGRTSGATMPQYIPKLDVAGSNPVRLRLTIYVQHEVTDVAVMGVAEPAGRGDPPRNSRPTQDIVHKCLLVGEGR